MNPADLLARAKLVVWDLDDTLWAGTIDSGDKPQPNGLHSWIEPLAHAGTMNSVCSNNTFEYAQKTLQDLGVWQWLVFPKISWSRKIEMLADLIIEMRLRADDVVYVDDAARHRHQAAQQLGLATVDPMELPLYDGRLDAAPPSDRLSQYRHLERRTQAEQGHGRQGSDAFLRQSEIRIALISAELGNAQRVAALSQRSNQLNFTESRLSPDAVGQLATDPDVEAGEVWARDKYGDYGLAGFYALRDHVIEHFFFSCRVLHLGIEAFVYNLLDRPAFETRPESVPAGRWGELDANAPWITLVERGRLIGPSDACQPATASRPKTYWVGGCDLEILSGYLTSEPRSADDCWLLPDLLNDAQVYARSSLLSLLASPEERKIQIAVPWMYSDITRERAEGPLDGEWQAMVLSPWVDCACWTYTHRETNLRIPSFARLDTNSPAHEWRHWWGSNPGAERFLVDYQPSGPLNPDEVTDLLVKLALRLKDRRLIVMNVPELATDRTYPWGQSHLDRHRSFNAAIARAAEHASNVEVLDVREHISTTDDLHDPTDPVLFHYRRDRYAALAKVARRTLDKPKE